MYVPPTKGDRNYPLFVILYPITLYSKNTMINVLLGKKTNKG